MSLFWAVFRQELTATWRDKRTLSSSILVPLLVIPLLTVGLPLLMGNLIGGQKERQQVVGVVGTLPPELRQELIGPAGHNVLLRPIADPKHNNPKVAVQTAQADAVMVLPPLAPPVMSGSQQVQPTQIQLYYKVGNLKAESGAAAKVKGAVERYNHTLLARKLHSLGLNEQVLTPVKLQTIDASNTAESSSGALAFIIPLFLLQFILAGATAAATDATAGERERGTFEALLSTPAPRSVLLLGKLAATTFTALMAAGFSVLGLTLSAPLAVLLTPAGQGAAQKATQAAFGGSLQLGAGGLGALLLTVAASALVISALLLTLSLFARSVREAQTLISPLSLLIVLPATLLQFADFLHTSPLLYALPLVGGMLAILDTVKGVLTPAHLGLSLGGNLLAAALLTLLALRFFGREGVAFR